MYGFYELKQHRQPGDGLPFFICFKKAAALYSYRFGKRRRQLDGFVIAV
jgi:hypothetical protein